MSQTQSIPTIAMVSATQPRTHLMRWLLTGFVLCAAFLLFLWTNGSYDIDDAPITYRYANNIAAGAGFVYNPGERILGTSTPLYALLLAGLKRLGVAATTSSNAFNLIGSLLVVLLSMELSRKTTHSIWAAVLTATYLLLQGSFLRYSMAGMETPVYMALILAAFLANAQSRTYAAAAIAGLAFLMRLDGLAVGAALFLIWTYERRRLPVRELLIYAAVSLPWLLFATLYFGSPIPQSLLAKQAHLLEHQTNPYWIWSQLFTNELGAPTYLLFAAFIGAVSLLVRREQRLPALAPLLWLAGYVVAYSVVGIEAYEWYLAPALAVIALCVGMGLDTSVLPILNQLRQCRSKTLRWLGIAALVACAILLFVPYARFAMLYAESFKTYLQDAEGSRVKAGQWLRSHAAADARVYAGAIGHVGLESGLYIIDGARLVTPAEALARIPRDYYVMDDIAPRTPECGPVAGFSTHGEVAFGNTLVAQCGLAPIGVMGDFTLSNMRITNWTYGSDQEWSQQSTMQLETQWLINAPMPRQEWTIFVHFTDAEGHTLLQADHLLGLQTDRSVKAVDSWNPERRIFTYTAMPEDWEFVSSKITDIRLGLWNPNSGEHLPISAGRGTLDASNRLTVSLSDVQQDQP